MRTITTASKQSGFSIVELMVASTIGLIILSGAVAVFSSNNSSGSLSKGMSRVQDSGRVAMDIIANDIRMAGYQGCADTEMIIANTIYSTALPTIDLAATPLQGAEYTAAGWNPARPPDLAAIDSVPLQGTDVLYLQHGSGRTTLLQSDMLTSTDTQINLARNPDHLSTGDLIMISDCSSVDIFRATSVGSGSSNIPVGFSTASNIQGNLNNVYTLSSGNALSDPMRIMRFHATAYFVANTTRTDNAANPIPALFSLDLSQENASPVELVEGVESLQLLYGEQLDTGGMRYVPASDANLSMNRVVSVQVGLLIKSIDMIASKDDSNDYQVADQTIGPPGGSTLVKHNGGRQLRTAFNTTVRLRNKR